MNHVKNLASPGGRYDWSWLTGRHVAQERNTLRSESDVLEPKASGPSLVANPVPLHPAFGLRPWQGNQYLGAHRRQWL